MTKTVSATDIANDLLRNQDVAVLSAYREYQEKELISEDDNTLRAYLLKNRLAVIQIKGRFHQAGNTDSLGIYYLVANSAGIETENFYGLVLRAAHKFEQRRCLLKARHDENIFVAELLGSRAKKAKETHTNTNTGFDKAVLEDLTSEIAGCTFELTSITEVIPPDHIFGLWPMSIALKRWSNWNDSSQVIELT